MNMNYKRGPLTAYAARGDFIESSFAQEDEEDNLNILGSPVSYYGLGPTSGAASAPKSEPIKIGKPRNKIDRINYCRISEYIRFSSFKTIWFYTII